MLRPVKLIETDTESCRSRFGWPRTATWVAIGLVLAVTILRTILILAGGFELSFDEAYYWHWSKHLDVCYFSKGPGIATLIYLTTSLFGDTEFGIRSAALACSTGMLLIVYFWTRNFFASERTALLSVLFFVAAPFFMGTGMLSTIDSPLVFSWTLATAWTWWAVESRRSVAWIAVGVAVALGTQCKFTMLFFLASLLTFAAISREDRWLIRSWRFYLPVLVVGVSLIPILLWNESVGWMTVRHTVDKASTARDSWLTLRHLLPSIGPQFAVVSPVLFVGVLIAMVRLVRDGGRSLEDAALEPRKAKFLFAMAAPILIFYSLLAFHRRVEANWVIASYITLLPAAAYYWLRPDTRFARVTVVLAVVLGFVSVAPIVMGDALYRAGMPQWVESMGVKFQPTWDVTNRLQGRKTLAREAVRRADALAEKSGRPVVILTDHYSYSSWIGFYGNAPDRVFVLPSPSPHNQFNMWERTHNRIPPEGCNAIAAYDRRGGGRLADDYFDSVDPVMEEVTAYRVDTPIHHYQFKTHYGFREEAWRKASQ